jgi:hypothetical protein
LGRVPAEKRKQGFEVVRRQVFAVAGHIEAAVGNLQDRLVAGALLGQVGELGAALAADAGDTVAEDAAVVVEVRRSCDPAQLPRERTRSS